VPAKQKKTKRETRENPGHEQNSDSPPSHWLELNKFSTIPRTVRLSETSVFLLDCYAAQLDATPSRLLSELLDDILPQIFKAESPQLKIQIVEHYILLKRAGVLHKVNVAELMTKIRMHRNIKASPLETMD